jgi:hypothetical protein
MTKPELEPKAFLKQYGDQSATFVIVRPGRQPESKFGWTLLDGLHRLSADPKPMSVTVCVHHIPVNRNVDYVAITDADYIGDLLELARKRE